MKWKRARPFISLLVVALGAGVTASQAGELDGQWQLGLSFGEIPFLAGSFKPGVNVGYHFDDRIFVGIDLQTNDHLQRDGESFNARNTGLEGLVSSEETTGVRALLSVRARPNRYLPYATVGIVFNGADTETMHFDERERALGAGHYDSWLTIEQTRPRGLGLAIGAGYQADFDGGLYLQVGIALALLSEVPRPEIEIEGVEGLTLTDRDATEAELERVYKENLHNHYHLFSLGLGYRFD